MKSGTALIMILVSLGLLYTFVSPQYQKTKVLQAESSQYQEVYNNVSELSVIKDELLAKYRALPTEEVEKLDKALPKEVDIVRLTMDFDAIGAQYGINIKDIKVENSLNQNSATQVVADTDQVGYQRVITSFSFITSYENFKKFMADIERSLRISDIRTVVFRAEESGLYKFDVTVETYSFK